MGLIKAAVGAVSGTLADQWKEAIRCENMTNDVWLRKQHQQELFLTKVQLL